MLQTQSARQAVTLLAALVMAAGAMVSAQTPAAPAAIPPAVLKAFQQAYPGATISASSQERSAERTVFRVESVDKGKRRTVRYQASGAVIEVAEQVTEQELPAPVLAAMRSHPRAIYGSGLKVTRGGSVEYHLTLRGTRKTAMLAKPDGTVVSFK
jgi:uncharacterized protein (DUF2267 family)